MRYYATHNNVTKPLTSSFTGDDHINNENLSFYLAGLIEGDGHIHIPKEYKTNKSKVAYIEIVFALKDKPSAELLKTIFGGNIYERSGKNLARWMIQDIKSLITIINCVNGKFRTPKVSALHNMIDYLNFKGENIVKLPKDTSELHSNAWLAGFIDSDGSFMIKGFTTSKKGLRSYISLQFYLPQRALDISGLSTEPFMQNIADFLGVKLHSRNFDGKFSQFVVNTSNNESNLILINYLNSFPLLSSKYLDYKDWEKAYYIFSKKLYKDLIYFEKIREIKLNMNKNRTFFSWDHHKTEVYGLNNM